MRRFFWLPALVLVAAGCAAEAETPPPPPDRSVHLEAQVDSLEHRAGRLENEVRLSHEFLEEYTRLVNETLAGLEGIAEREGVLRQIRLDVEDGSDGAPPSTIERRLHENLQAIELHLAEGRRRQQQLRDLARRQAGDLDALKGTIDGLHALVEAKEATIAELRREAARLLERIDRLHEQNTRLADENATLREAYYVAETAEVLIERGIIERRRGLLRLRQRTRLDDLDPRHFTAADVHTAEIPLGVVGKIQILSEHRRQPALFRLEARADGTSALVLVDAEAFWRISRFLVVEVQQ